MPNRLFKHRELWSFRVFRANSLDQIFELSLDKCDLVRIFQQPMLRLSPKFESVIADPFLFVHEDRLFIFYEVKTEFGDGVIHAASMDASGTWKNHGCVLREGFHLSYPNVFRVSNTIYMLPETASSGKVILYRSRRFPDDWVPEKVLVNEPLLDPVLISREHGYLLLGTTPDYELIVFQGTNLNSPFRRCESIIKDRRFSRNAGQVLSINGRSFRVSQDCELKYGSSIALSEILRADADSYEEKLLKPELLARKSTWMHDGYHTLNTAEFGGQFYFALDGRRDDLLTNNIFHAIHKLTGKVRRAQAVSQRAEPQ